MIARAAPWAYFSLDLVANTRRHKIPIQKVVLDNLPQEFLADEIDHGGILDRGRLAVDARLPARLGEIEPIGDAAKTDPAQQIQRKAGRENVVHGMKDGQAGRIGVGGNHPPAIQSWLWMISLPSLRALTVLMTLFTISRWNSTAVRIGSPV